MMDDAELLRLSGGVGLVAFNPAMRATLDRFWREGLVAKVEENGETWSERWPHFRRTPAGDLAMPPEADDETA